MSTESSATMKISFQCRKCKLILKGAGKLGPHSLKCGNNEFTMLLDPE